MKQVIEKLFGFDFQKHHVRTEIYAGITTFLTMAYILAVNPSIFSALPEMPGGSVFTATALAAVVGTLVMAIYAKKPFAIAPGMGMNAFFVFTVCLAMGYHWKFALTAVLIEGVIFFILTVTKVRSLLLSVIPHTLKKAIGAGIGLFIAFIGMQNAGIIITNDTTLVSLGNVTSGTALLAMIGLFITAALVMAKVRGGILWGILIATLIGMFIKDPATGQAITQLDGVVSAPQSLTPIFCQFEWNQVFSWNMLVVVFTLLFLDIFNTMGTIIGVYQGTGMGGYSDKNNKIPDLDKMFVADSLATIASACLGTSTNTTYVESAAGVGEGGRTGLTAFTTAICFALALFFCPLFLAIPGAATAPALIIVGVMMMPSLDGIDWDDYCKAIPAFLTILLMPVAYSICDGILIGVIAYVGCHAVAGRFKEISITMWVLAILFICKYIFI